jgi:hypothetical protein
MTTTISEPRPVPVDWWADATTFWTLRADIQAAPNRALVCSLFAALPPETTEHNAAARVLSEIHRRRGAPTLADSVSQLRTLDRVLRVNLGSIAPLWLGWLASTSKVEANAK